MAYKDRTISFNGIPKPSAKWFFLTVLLSLLLHLISYVNVSYISDSVKENRLAQKANDQKVKIKIVSSSPKDQQIPKKILETKLKETEAPKESKYKGHQNHIAKKETRLDTKNRQLNDREASQSSHGSAKTPAQQAQQPQAMTQPKIGVGSGKVRPNESRSLYESLLPKTNDLTASRQSGYQEYLEDELEIGDRIDLNTSSYRYIGYFTGLRKGWSQTWVYPSEAVRKGWQGKVKIEFTISKDGKLKRVKVLEGSGHTILDDAVVDAIRLSSPYAPLPDGFGKEKLTIVYSFIYKLRGYGAY